MVGAGTGSGRRAAGYSGTPLWKKLGYRPGMRVTVLGAPEDYAELLGELPQGVALRTTLRGGELDLVHLFASDLPSFVRRFDACRDAIARDGSFWVSWPKKSSGVATDLDENVIRDHALGNGLVDVKVAAVDDTWSALKLVYRLTDR